MKEKRTQKINWLIVVALFVVVSAVNVVNPSDTVRVNVEDGCLVLEGCESAQYSVPMNTIEQVTYLEEPDYATDSRGVVCGTFTNEVWGKHVLYADTKIDVCIVVESVNGTYVFNMEREDTTKAFYEAFLEIL